MVALNPLNDYKRKMDSSKQGIITKFRPVVQAIQKMKQRAFDGVRTGQDDGNLGDDVDELRRHLSLRVLRFEMLLVRLRIRHLRLKQDHPYARNNNLTKAESIIPTYSS